MQKSEKNDRKRGMGGKRLTKGKKTRDRMRRKEQNMKHERMKNSKE